MVQGSNPPQYVHEAVSPQERAGWRRRFSEVPLPKLKAIASELFAAAQSKATDKESNIAASHYDPALVCEVLETREVQHGKFKKKQTVYCSPKRCPSCPHGPYWYAYRSSKRKRKVAVCFDGVPGLPQQTLNSMRETSSIRDAAAYRIEIYKEH